MPQGPGTYGSKVGRPAKKKYKKGGSTKKSATTKYQYALKNSSKYTQKELDALRVARDTEKFPGASFTKGKIKYQYGEEIVTPTPGPAATAGLTVAEEDAAAGMGKKKPKGLRGHYKKPSRWGKYLGRKLKSALHRGVGGFSGEKAEEMASLSDEYTDKRDTARAGARLDLEEPAAVAGDYGFKKGGKVKKYLKGGGLKVGDVTDRGEVVSIHPKSGNVKYKEGTDKTSRAAEAKRSKYAKGEAGEKQMGIDDLAAERNQYEKGSAEYIKVQNEINKLSGVEKRHAEPKKETFKERRARKKSEKSEKRKGKLAKRRGYSDADLERVSSYAGKDWAMDDTINKEALAAYQAQQKEANKPKSEFVKEGFKLEGGGQVGESSGGGLFNWPSTDARKR